MATQIVPKVITQKKSILRTIIAFLFGKHWACSYCGKFYTAKCHTDKINIFYPIPQNGRCCPDGHEGYTDEFTGYAIIRYHFDFVTNPPPSIQRST